MFERFSRSSIRVVILAQEEARRFRYDSVGPELILLGIIGESLSHAAKVLRSCEIDIARARDHLKNRQASGSTLNAVELPFTPDAKRLLQESWKLSKQLGVCEISPDHILLAMIQEGKGIALETLSALGANVQTIRGQVLAEIDKASPSIYVPMVGVPNAVKRYAVKPSPLIAIAQEESRRLGHNFVGTEQILLALLRDKSEVSARALKSVGVTLKAARAETEKIVGRGRGFVAVEIPFTPRAKRVLELAWKEAKQLGHSYLTDAHVLLGLIQEKEGVAIRVLEKLGVKLPELRQHVLKLMIERKPSDG